MPNVLLTGIIGPHGNLHFDLAGDRLTRDQDIFTLKSHFHYVALHFIAQNLSSPCVVLEHPELEDFEAELRKGYDFVGINFTMVNITKMIQMCDAVRRVAPGTQIVLGGYGTSCFNTIFKGNTEIHKLADHVCYGEGVTFLRRLLGEPLDTPITQPVGPRGATGLPWLEPYPKGSGGHIVSGLGCQNMCEFCSTAAYYGGAALAAPARQLQQRRHLRREPLQGQAEGHAARRADPSGRRVRAVEDELLQLRHDRGPVTLRRGRGSGDERGGEHLDRRGVGAQHAPEAPGPRGEGRLRRPSRARHYHDRLLDRRLGFPRQGKHRA
jgi:hypothetical protein